MTMPKDRLLGTLAMLAVLCAGYWSTWGPLIEKWNGPTYSLGYLVVPICVYLLLRQVSISRPAERASLFGIAIVFIGVVSWVIATFANIMIVASLSVPLILFGAMVTLFGSRSFFAFIFPVAYLVFAIPVWDYINGLLQWLTISVNRIVLGVIQVPAIIEGSFVYFRNGAFEIASGCAGLHFFVTALAIASLNAYLSFRSVKTRLLFVVIATVLALTTNWLRVIVIIYAGYRTDMQHYLVTVDHYWFGWVLFMVMLVPLYMIGSRLETLSWEKRTEVSQESEQGSAIPNISIVGLSVCLALIVAAPLLTMSVQTRQSSLDVALQLPDRLGDLDAGRELEVENYRFPGARVMAARRFYGASVPESIDLFAVAYSVQRQGAELVSDSNRLYDTNVWRTVDPPANVTLGSESLNWLFIEEKLGGTMRVVGFQYVVGDHVLTDPVAVKFKELGMKFRGAGVSGLISLSTTCATDCQAEVAGLGRLVMAADESLRSVIVIR